MRFKTLVLILVLFITPLAFAEKCPIDKFALWSGKYLHGANIFMGRNPGGGVNGIGDGNFQQSDFDELRQTGANYIQLSHAGIFTENAPYQVDPIALATLDLNILRARAAGLYVVIAFRSGPGRNENTITNRAGQLLETIWTDSAARDAWVDMLRFTANRYKDNPTVVGYSIMVEPNSYAALGFPGPNQFYASYAGTLRDVNILYSLATTAIRQVDSNTPILLEPEGYGNVSWLPYLKLNGDSKTVYTPHDYTPFDYTHQLIPNANYPGNYDIDYNGTKEYIDKNSLNSFLQTVRQFSFNNSVPVAITEFGVKRTASNALSFIADRVEIQNPIGSWAVWTWQPNGFDDPFSIHDRSYMQNQMAALWANNCTPIFSPSINGTLNGITIYSRGNKPRLSGVKVYADKKLAISGVGGNYSFSLPAKSYTIRATSKGQRCRIGSARGSLLKKVTILKNLTNNLNIYCSAR